MWIVVGNSGILCPLSGLGRAAVVFDGADGAAAAADDVADSTLVIFRFGATMELGRSERPLSLIHI